MDGDGDLPPKEDLISVPNTTRPPYCLYGESSRGGGGGGGGRFRGGRGSDSRLGQTSVTGTEEEDDAMAIVLSNEEELEQQELREDQEVRNEDEEEYVEEEEDEEEEEEEDDDDDEDEVSADENSPSEGVGDNDDEEGGTTDAGLPRLGNFVTDQVLVKRPHVQSKRMLEYQAMQLMTHTTGRVRRCPQCRKILYSAPGLRYHMQTHLASPENFTCDSCHKVFKSRNGLKYHRKGKRCQGCVRGSNSSPTKEVSVTLTSDGSRVVPPPLVLSPRDDCPAPRLLDLAHIATGPQSPLLQSVDPSRSVASSFFDSPEKNAVMALSSMAQKRTSRSSTMSDHEEVSHAKCGGGEEASSLKSKRPMNGFMLFAQKNRAEFNRMYPHTNNRIISTKLSEEWGKLPDEERQRWKEDARQMAEVQRSKHPDCWKRKKYSKHRH